MTNLTEKLQKIYEDIYEGRGLNNPSIIARIQSMEDRLTNLEDYLETKERKLETKMNILITTVLGAILTFFLQHYHLF